MIGPQRPSPMARIKSQDTRPERIVQARLAASGMSFIKQANLPGKPDFFLPAMRTAIFVHGCFWHGCPLHFIMPRTNPDFWAKKIARNIAREIEVSGMLGRMGIRPLIIWEHELG